MIIPADRVSWLKRSDDSSDDSGGSGLSSQDQIIIGVVVGGVAFIAIIAGAVFVLYKKRRWDRIQRHEEQLLALQMPHSYKHNQQPSRPHSSFDIYNTAREVEQPPAYHQFLSSSLPVYDPSKYQNIHPASVQVNPAYPFDARRLSYLPPPPVAAAAENRPFSFVRGSQDLTRHSALLSSRGPSPEDWRPSMQSDRGVSPTGTGHLSVDSSSQPLVDGMRPPRRPKPVLSKLITNFG